MIKAKLEEFLIGDKIKIKDNTVEILNIRKGKYLVLINGTQKKKFRAADLFEYLCMLEDNNILTHNCQMRIVCGRLGTIPSLMALGSTVGTTISGKRPGAGMISSNGVVENIQYYFAKHSWIERWFNERGLNKKGYEDNASTENELDKLALDAELEKEEDLEFYQDITKIEFSGVKGEVNKTTDQKFEEI